MGLIALFMHAIEIGLYTARYLEAADGLIIAGFALMAICWVWSIIKVSTTGTLQGSQRKLWLIAVIAIPFVAFMFYHRMHSKRNTVID